MSNLDFSHVDILEPYGVDIVCESIQGSLSELCFIGKSFGRVYRHVVDGLQLPFYFNRSGNTTSHHYVNMTNYREFCKPSFVYCYPYGEQELEDFELNGGIHYSEQRIAVICIFNIKEFDLQSMGLNHIFVEEIKNDILGVLIREDSVSSKIKIYDQAEDVMKGFDIKDKSFYMFPYGSIRFDFKARFELCENKTALQC